MLNPALCLDIRKWYLPKNDVHLQPTRRGVALKLSEFNEFFTTLPTINDDIPCFEGVIPCQYTHGENGGVEKGVKCFPSASFKE